MNMKIPVYPAIILLLLTACGGGGGTGDNGNTSDPDNLTPTISGFDITLSTGDYWEFSWDRETSSSSYGTGSSGESNGVFRITLGNPAIIGDLTAFPLITTGNYRQGIDGNEPFVAPRWTHIAIQDNTVLLSSDGVNFETVFNANSGYVIGFGFFQLFSDSNLFEISEGTISNDYINASDNVYVLRDSASESNCEYFEGYGTICGDSVTDGLTIVRQECYQANIGPIGMFYSFSFSASDLSYTSSEVINIGLVASSLRGDEVNYDLETEANNTPQTASPITSTNLPVTIRGDFGYQADIDVSLPENYATTYRFYTNGRNEVEPNNSMITAETINLNESIHGALNSSDPGEAKDFSFSINNISTVIEDWFVFEKTESRAFDVSLEFLGAADNVDIDLWLFDSAGNLALSPGDVALSSYDNNNEPDGSDDREYIRADVDPGTYYIGVDIWPEEGTGNATSADYTLSVNLPTFGDFAATSNEYVIRDFYEVELISTAGLEVSITNGYGIFILDSNDLSVLASEPETYDPEAIATLLQTNPLSPGTYLLAIGATGNVTLDSNYEFTIDFANPAAQ